MTLSAAKIPEATKDLPSSLMYYRGMYELNKYRTSILFSAQHGPPVFAVTMSRQRYIFLSTHFRFDDLDKREERRKFDWFAAYRKVFEDLNKKFDQALVPTDYVSLDEK